MSKRRDRPYQTGRSKHWVKVKNRKHPAMGRVMKKLCMQGTVVWHQPKTSGCERSRPHESRSLTFRASNHQLILLEAFNRARSHFIQNGFILRRIDVQTNSIAGNCPRPANRAGYTRREAAVANSVISHALRLRRQLR